ncbi:MAG: NIPSNAP family protein [Rhodanobacteraceae bacterium]|nr:MAG: NIPSNAP family protein [Rhodanobacteraceae bacterium]
MNPTAPRPTDCAVIELRQYTLHPRKRETLIELFEREFVEPQEAVGVSVIGTFRDLDRPDRFTWLRGFADMRARRRALADFYGGPVWKAHRDAANATMIDSDDVLLLRPAWPGAGFDLDPGMRPVDSNETASEELVIARIYPFDATIDPALIEWFRHDVVALFDELGAQTVAVLVSEDAKNDFPALPVREGEHVLAWFARFDDHAAYARFFEAVTHSRHWNETVLPELQRHLLGKPPLLRLAPTTRSLLR